MLIGGIDVPSGAVQMPQRTEAAARLLHRGQGVGHLHCGYESGEDEVGSNATGPKAFRGTGKDYIEWAQAWQHAVEWAKAHAKERA